MKPLLLLLVLGLASIAGAAEPAHPFMLWTREEAAAIRHRIETEPWAQERSTALLAEKGQGQTFSNLFRFLVLGDESVVEPEKKYLLSLIGTDPRQFKGDTGGGRHFDQYLSVLRYDALYDRLTPEQREGLEKTFRDFIRHHCEEETLVFTRTSWLPNMQWPRPLTAHLMAVALRDETLVRQCFGSKGGWKYYFDDYLSDGRFYNEEFGKQYSMVGEMFLWCRGVERLGLPELGFGYRGRTGATMRRTVESMIELGYPRVDIPGGRPHYPLVSMGDARGGKVEGAPPYLFQLSLVAGALPGRREGERTWMSANMNGRDHRNEKVAKMLAPHWFELAHAQWPDGPFAYFLAQMRPVGEPRYFPSLFWGVSPIDPATVSLPPAPSYLARERGFALLRAEESPAYWEGPAPAVAFQLATYYVHYAHDAFSLLGLYAFNRPIYLNRQVSNGYGGGCPWTDSPRGHCGVLVDNLQYELNADDPTKDHPHWPNPIGEVPTRFDFRPEVKFIAAVAQPLGAEVSLDNRQPLAGGTLSLDLRREDKEVWPGVKMERALFLTREYLADIYRLQSAQPHRYDWQVHPLGRLVADAKWASTDELTLASLYDLDNRAVAKRFADPVEASRYALREVRKLIPGDASWSATFRQSCSLPDAATSLLTPAWYERNIGVRVHLAGAPGTTVFAGRTPESRAAAGREANKGGSSSLPNEVGGETLLVRRQAAETVFAAVHEPFEGAPKIEHVQQMASTTEGIYLRLLGGGIDDRILYAYGADAEADITLAASGESFTFHDYLFLRQRGDVLEVSGGLRALKCPALGATRLRWNGAEVAATVAGGVMTFVAPPLRQ